MLKKVFIIFLFLNSGLLFAQEKVLFGTQKSFANKNAQLESKELILTQTYIIVKVETNADGFWIQSGTKIIYNFLKQKGVFYPTPEGCELKPGKYKVFPNLNQDQDSAYVKIILRKKT